METMTTTKTTSNTKMAIATLAMLGAGAVALATVPMNTQAETVAAPGSCQVTSVTLGSTCGATTKGGSFTCKDGWRAGFSLTKCSTKEYRDEMANRVCSGHCKGGTTGCLVNINYGNPCTGEAKKYAGAQVTCSGNGMTNATSFTQCQTETDHRAAAAAYCSSQSCAAPAETCVDRDGGADIYVASSTVIMVDGHEGGGDNLMDTCISDTTVSEGICSGNQGVSGNPIPTAVAMPCGTGYTCNNGACVTNPASAVQVSWADNTPVTLVPTPTGGTWTESKTIGAIKVVNTKNTPVTIKTLNFNLHSTLSTTDSRTIGLYRVTTDGYGGTLSYRIANKSFGAGVPFTDTVFTDANVVDTVIPALGTIIFKVTATVATTPPESQITISLGADDIAWSDGSNTYSTAQGLPLDSRTLSASPRTQVHANWASDTPYGATSKGSAQTIGKLVLKNDANPGQYTAKIKTINLDFTSTISRSGIIQIYRDDLNSTPLLTYTFTSGTFSNTSFVDADFTDVEIAAGTNKTFYVVADTSNADPFDTLTVGVGTNDVEWSDGVIPSITGTLGTDLPLPYKTLAY